ncbi:MAG TPA: tetratricopeptide repeat protein, partial [Candidatus Wallbacteria bacterium]|nr:tetratricopeptide repeat protein [Candidatus Wallbacteria bacterium]
MTELRKKILVLLVIIFAAAFMFPAKAYAIRAQAQRFTDEGTELLKLNKLAEAEAKFKAAIDEDGSFDKPYYYMAQVCERNSNHEEAINYIKRALRNSPHEEVYKSYQCDINNAIAAEAIKNGNPDRATKIYYSNLEMLPFHMPTYNRLAMHFIGKGDYNGALLQSNKALESSSSMPPTLKFDISESAILHANMAVCFYELKNFSRAISEIDIALKTKDGPYVQKYYKKIMSEENPVFAELKKAETAFSTGNMAAAREGFERVLGMYPNCASAVEKISLIDRKKKIEDIIAEADKFLAGNQLAEAIEKYSEVLSIEPQRNDIRDKIKDIEGKMGQQQKDALASMKRNKPKDTDSADLVDKKLKALVERDQASNDPNKLYETKFKEAEDLYNKQDYDNALDKYMNIAEDKDDFKPDEIKKRIKAIHAAKGEFYFESMQTAVPKLYLYLVMVLVILIVIYIYTGEQIASMFRADPYKFAKKGAELLEK